MKQTDISREQAAALVSRMTAEEKLGLLTTHQHAVGRLGLQEFYIGTEVARGFVGRDAADHSTVFPQPVGLASTFDRDLLRQLGDIAGTECRAYYNREHKHALCVWGPTVDMERDPRWGRTEEAYGEDPFLAGELTAALTSGMAGEHPVYLKVLPTLKHFCANNCEEERVNGNSCLPPRLKYEYYYAAFMPAIRFGGAKSVMTAYNEVNGIPALCNPDLKRILKEKWGLWFAVTDGADFGQTLLCHKYGTSHAEVFAEAIRAGGDIMTDDDALTEHAAKCALRDGLLTESELDEMLTNVIYARMRLGQLSDDCPYDSITPEAIDTEASRAVNLRAAEEQFVLLKNDGMLPLKNPKRIAVCGPLADENLMDWYTGYFRDAVSAADGMRAEFPDAEILFDSLWDIVALQAENGKYLCVHPDGSCAFDAETVTEDAQFFLQDWGENWQNLVACGSGRCLRAADQGGLALHNRRVYDWFTHETFRLHETPDGTMLEALFYKKRMEADADGVISFTDQTAVTPARTFRLTVIRSGADRAEAIAEQADAVIYCTGNHPVQVAKECFDRKTLALNIQPGMAERLHSVNPQTAMLLISGYPYAINREQEILPAILWSSHAGAHLGTAAAHVISGKYNPAGRLPLTWYRSAHELPEIGNYDIETTGMTYLYFRGKPLYPFGFGLSYAAFRYENMTVRPEPDGSLTASVTLQNIAEAGGDEVIQIYFAKPGSAVSRPIRKLCGFARVYLAAGERRTAEITIPPYILQIYDPHSGRMLTESGAYQFYAGGSSDALPLCVSAEICGETIPLRERRFDAEQYDAAFGVTIGYCRELRRQDIRVRGWFGTAVYAGVPLAGAKKLTLRAASPLHPAVISVQIGAETLEFPIAPSNCESEYHTVSAPLPDDLPETGMLVVNMQSGVSLLELELT